MGWAESTAERIARAGCVLDGALRRAMVRAYHPRLTPGRHPLDVPSICLEPLPTGARHSSARRSLVRDESMRRWRWRMFSGMFLATPSLFLRKNISIALPFMAKISAT